MEHLHRWIKKLMEGIDSEVDEDIRAKILEGCGRSCVSRSFIGEMKDAYEESKDVDGLLERINEAWESAGAKARMKREEDGIYAEYGECYCPLVKDYLEELSPSWCQCSQGWLMELFESVLGKPVQVELEKSVKHGEDLCRFKIIP